MNVVIFFFLRMNVVMYVVC